MALLDHDGIGKSRMKEEADISDLSHHKDRRRRPSVDSSILRTLTGICFIGLRSGGRPEDPAQS